MTPISLQEIADRIKSDRDFDDIRRLRRVKSLDRSSYAHMKKTLSWFCCGSFGGNIRRVTEFKSINHFVLDFDGLSEHGLTAASVKRTLNADKRVLMSFTSPGGDGIKALFKLVAPIKDAKLYSDFYKSFAVSFSRQKGLEQSCDLSTNDVSRVCFYSSDPEMYFNPEADAVEVPEQMIYDSFFGSEAKDAVESTTEQGESKAEEKGPGETALAKIKDKLLQKKSCKKPRPTYFIPSRLKEELPHLLAHLETNELYIKEVVDIHYGYKIKVEFAGGDLKAEANLYYGKKGYSLVIPPSNGSHPTLRELLEKLVWEHLYSTPGEGAKIRNMYGYGNS